MGRRTKEKLQREFVCCKCHSHNCVIQQVNVASGPLSRMIPVGGGAPFYALSCSLCGYTEFYSLTLAATDEAPATVKSDAPLTREAENQ